MTYYVPGIGYIEAPRALEDEDDEIQILNEEELGKVQECVFQTVTEVWLAMGEYSVYLHVYKDVEPWDLSDDVTTYQAFPL